MSVNISELKRFRAEKDGVFARDPHSPLTDDQRRNFQGLEYFDENPQLVIHAGIDRQVDPEEVRMGTSSGEEQVYHRYGLVRFRVDEQPAQLTLYSLRSWTLSRGRGARRPRHHRLQLRLQPQLRVRLRVELPIAAHRELAQGPDPRRREDVRCRA